MYQPMVAPDQYSTQFSSFETERGLERVHLLLTYDTGNDENATFEDTESTFSSLEDSATGLPNLVLISPSGIRYELDNSAITKTTTDENGKVFPWGVKLTIEKPEVGTWYVDDSQVPEIDHTKTYGLTIFGIQSLPENTATVYKADGSEVKVEKEEVKGIITVKGTTKNVDSGTIVTVLAGDAVSKAGRIELGKGVVENNGYTINIDSNLLQNGEYYISTTLKIDGTYTNLTALDEQSKDLQLAVSTKATAQGSILINNDPQPLKKVQNLIVTDFVKTTVNGPTYGINFKFTDVNGMKAKGFTVYVENVTTGAMEEINLGYLTKSQLSGFSKGDTLKVWITSYDEQNNVGEASDIVELTLGSVKEVKNPVVLAANMGNIELSIGANPTQLEIGLLNTTHEKTSSALDYAVAKVISAPKGLFIHFKNNPVSHITADAKVRYEITALDDKAEDFTPVIVPGTYPVTIQVENFGNPDLKSTYTLNVVVKPATVKITQLLNRDILLNDRTPIEITGDFIGKIKVLVDGKEVPLLDKTNDLVRFQLPNGLAQGPHTVQIVGEGTDNTSKTTFEVTKPTVAISLLNPYNHTIIGTEEKVYLKITGQNGWNEAVTVDVKNLPTNVSAVLDTSSVIPGQTIALTIKVTGPVTDNRITIPVYVNGEKKAQVLVQVGTTPVTPIIAKLSDTSFIVGQDITIYGSGFTPGSRISINGQEIEQSKIKSITWNRIILTTYTDMPQGTLTITTAYGTAEYTTPIELDPASFDFELTTDSVLIEEEDSAAVALKVWGDTALTYEVVSPDSLLSANLRAAYEGPVPILHVIAMKGIKEGVYRVVVKASSADLTCQRTLLVTVKKPIQHQIQIQMLNNDKQVINNGVYPRFNVINTGTTVINLADVKVRYYYTIDGENTQNFYCDWSNIGSAKIKGHFVKLPTPKTGADYYMEVGFTPDAGTLAPGQSVQFATRFTKSNWTNYNQSNDYSWRISEGFLDQPKVTGWVESALIYGIEP
jgi:hypothetical protein